MKILYIPARNSVHLGLLYNEATLNDARQVAPEGWRVSNVQDYIDLFAYLEGEAVAGGKMKTVETWQSPNTGATNDSGLKALPAGKRDELGAFSGKLTETAFWLKNL